MRIRTTLLTLMAVGVIACGFSAPAFAASHKNCSTSQSSAGSTYGGQGTQITGVDCDGPTPPTTPSASSSLPFTGLDVGLLVAAGAVLVATGLVLRWRLRSERQ